MSDNPFHPDATISARIAALRAAGAGDAIAAAVSGTVVDAAQVADLVARHGLGGVEDLMLLLLPRAETLSRPPISNFHVGAVGLERETGSLILGGNLEFPGAPLSHTVHAEGAVFTRAYLRGTSVAAIAIGEAHPCAHCRQYISEFARSRELVLIDPLGHRLTMGQLYPWPFDPAYLGQAGAVAGTLYWPGLRLETEGAPADVRAALVAAGGRAWAPYSGSPAGLVLGLADGTLVSGCSIESVAFNPGISPLQAALIALAATGRPTSAIATATLAQDAGGKVDHARSTAELLSSVAAGASLGVQSWSPP